MLNMPKVGLQALTCRWLDYMLEHVNGNGWIACFSMPMVGVYVIAGGLGELSCPSNLRVSSDVR